MAFFDFVSNLFDYGESITKEKLMKLFTIFIALLVSGLAYAGHHEEGEAGLNLKPRQATSVLNVTSVDMGSDKTTITASGKMGEYGKVYVTYNMTYAADGVSGAVEGVGRGVVDAETVMTGRFTGIWRREGSTVTMHNTVNMNDGSQNFDIITFDARGDTLIHKVFILR